VVLLVLGVRGYLEPLAGAADWGAVVLGRTRKSKAKKYVLAEQRRDLDSRLRDKSTLALYATVASKRRTGLPEYLKRVCPSGLRSGRRLKTKFRLGAHQLRASSARMVRHDRWAVASRCECSNAGVEETIRHAMFECRAHDGIRTTFVERVEGAYPEFGDLSQDARFRLLMAEDTPKEIDMLLYRYLIQIFESRERGPLGLLSNSSWMTFLILNQLKPWMQSVLNWIMSWTNMVGTSDHLGEEFLKDHRYEKNKTPTANLNIFGGHVAFPRRCEVKTWRVDLKDYVLTTYPRHIRTAFLPLVLKQHKMS
jgi:hypothetical protein